MLILDRHGRTAANADGRLQGRLDLPLDPVGLVQVAAAAARVGSPDRLVSSPLSRARETASAFSGGVPIEIDERWSEVDYGDLEGVHMAEIGEKTWARWRADVDFSPPNGESMAALGKRVREACEDLCADAADRLVVVASHVSPIKAAVAWALGVDVSIAWRTHLDQGSLCRIAITPNGPSLLSFNELPAPIAG